MSNFSLSEVAGLKDRLPSMPLSQLRALVNAGAQDLMCSLDGWDDQIEDWASGGYQGEDKIKNAYCYAFDHPNHKIAAIFAFDTLMCALRKREQFELKKALSAA